MTVETSYTLQLQDVVQYSLGHNGQELVLPVENKRKTQIPTTQEMLGLPAGTPIIETRMPLADTAGVWHITHRGVKADGAEGVMDISAEHMIVPQGLDPTFLAYREHYYGPLNTLSVDPDIFSSQDIGEILGEYPGARYYGLWPALLPDGQQIVPAEDYARGNSKAELAAYVPNEYLPPQALIQEGSPIDEDTFRYVLGEEDRLWAKTAEEGMAGLGVRACTSLHEVEDFRQEMRGKGIQGGILLERHMPGIGGSFTLVKRADGHVSLLAVTDQLSDAQGRRTGNVIYDISQADKRFAKLIHDVTAVVEHHPSFDGALGCQIFDIVRDREGRPYINDPARRKSGVTPTALLREDWTQRHDLDPSSVHAGQVSLYLKGSVPFMTALTALGELGQPNGICQAIVRAHYNDPNGEWTSFKLALMGHSVADTELLKNQCQERLYNAGLLE